MKRIRKIKASELLTLSMDARNKVMEKAAATYLRDKNNEESKKR